jgi:hypothetical protein
MTDRITDRLTSYPRRAVVDQIVIHESVTSSRASTLAVLRARKLSVHIIVDRDGSVTQHAPLEEACVHAGKLNNRSVAVEVVNRYYGRHADDGQQVIDAVWAHKRRYIVPPLVQCEAVWGVVEDVLGHVATIPSTFPGVAGRGFIWGRLPVMQRLRVPAGVMAHHRTDHADGLFVEHYCWQRAHDRSPQAAWRRTVEAASSGLKITADLGWTT